MRPAEKLPTKHRQSRAREPRASAAPVDRRALLAQVHIAKKDLALDESSYRGLLQRIAGTPSASNCTEPQLLAVVAEFRRLGWAPKVKRPASRHAHVRKVYAVWGDMKDLVSNPSRQALDAFTLRQTGVSSPEWLDGQQANKVIEGLKAWRQRLQIANRVADV